MSRSLRTARAYLALTLISKFSDVSGYYATSWTGEHGMTDVSDGATDARPPASENSVAAVLGPALTVGWACGESEAIQALEA